MKIDFANIAPGKYPVVTEEFYFGRTPGEIDLRIIIRSATENYCCCMFDFRHGSKYICNTFKSNNRKS